MLFTLFLISQVRGGDGRAQLLNMVQPDSLVQALQQVCESVAPKSQRPPVVDGDQGGCSSSFKAERAGMSYEKTWLFFFFFYRPLFVSTSRFFFLWNVGKNTNGLVCKGLFGTVCGHAVPYSFVNVENGEKIIYLHFKVRGQPDKLMTVSV